MLSGTEGRQHQTHSQFEPSQGSTGVKLQPCQDRDASDLANGRGEVRTGNTRPLTTYYIITNVTLHKLREAFFACALEPPNRKLFTIGEASHGIAAADLA